MLKTGDIITIKGATNQGKSFGYHPFIVISTGQRKNWDGRQSDFMAVKMTSISKPVKLRRLLSHPANIPAFEEEKHLLGNLSKDSYADTSQLFCFKESDTPYKFEGCVSENVLERIQDTLQHHKELGFDLIMITENLYSMTKDREEYSPSRLDAIRKRANSIYTDPKILAKKQLTFEKMKMKFGQGQRKFISSLDYDAGSVFSQYAFDSPDTR